MVSMESERKGIAQAAKETLTACLIPFLLLPHWNDYHIIRV